MIKISTSLWQAYSETIFYLNVPIYYTKYVIVTACNPFSIRGSEHDNRNRNTKLLKRLEGENFVSLFAGDRKKQWLEESFAVEISLQKGLNLARDFEQNAIYYVENDELWLLSVDENREYLGKMSQKLDKG